MNTKYLLKPIGIANLPTKSRWISLNPHAKNTPHLLPLLFPFPLFFSLLLLPVGQPHCGGWRSRRDGRGGREGRHQGAGRGGTKGRRGRRLGWNGEGGGVGLGFKGEGQLGLWALGRLPPLRPLKASHKAALAWAIAWARGPSSKIPSKN